MPHGRRCVCDGIGDGDGDACSPCMPISNSCGGGKRDWGEITPPSPPPHPSTCAWCRGVVVPFFVTSCQVIHARKLPPYTELLEPVL